MTAGDATAEGEGGGDDEDGAAHPATTMPTITSEIRNRLMAAPTVRQPCRFPRARASPRRPAVNVLRAARGAHRPGLHMVFWFGTIGL
jgi:hypothetical protein